MRIRAAHILPALAFAALAGCDEAQEAVDDAARVTAKATVEKVLTVHLPEGVPSELVTPYSDCIIDSATGNELFRLSRASVTGIDADEIALVTDIIQRPETTACISRKALGVQSG